MRAEAARSGPEGEKRAFTTVTGLASDSCIGKLDLSCRCSLTFAHGYILQEKPRDPVRVGAGFWVSGVDALVVNRAEYPLQHAMRVPSPQLCSVTGRGSVADFCEVLPFQHIPSLWHCLAEGQDSNLTIKLPSSIPSGPD